MVAPAPPPVEPIELPSQFPSEEQFEALCDGATKYFDLDEDLYVGRLAFTEAIDEVGGSDRVLADMGLVHRIIDESRFFYPQMHDKRWREGEGIHCYKGTGRWHHVTSEDLGMAFSLPKGYPRENSTFRKRPRPGPYPLVVSMMEIYPGGAEWPGFEHLDRRFKKGIADGLLDEAIVLVPTSSDGSYTDEEERLDHDLLTYQLARFVRRYHVDFDRIVLDGGTDVFAAATQQPFLYAGIVVRPGSVLPLDLITRVSHFANVPVFVQDDSELYDDLERFGHPDVTFGTVTDVADWIRIRRRMTPRTFRWRIDEPIHQFAYWINLEQLDWAAPERVIDVGVVGNEVRIDATGVYELSLYLNDDIVSLSDSVRVVVNGRPLFEEQRKRSLDVMFNRYPLKIRESMFFSLLFPVRILRISVADPDDRIVSKPPSRPKPPNANTVTGTASREDEARAKKLMELARKYVDDGSPEARRGAIKRLEAVVRLGDTSFRVEAERLLAALRAMK